MDKKKDFYWITTKSEYLERIKVLPSVYHIAVWEYLHSYIIRGETDIPNWTRCFELFRDVGLLAASISIPTVASSLRISPDKTRKVLKELDLNNTIIKYSSKNQNQSNNVNVYILGFSTTEITSDTTITRYENFFVETPKTITPEIRDTLINLFSRQEEIAKDVEKLSAELVSVKNDIFQVHK